MSNSYDAQDLEQRTRITPPGNKVMLNDSLRLAAVEAEALSKYYSEIAKYLYSLADQVETK